MYNSTTGKYGTVYNIIVHVHVCMCVYSVPPKKISSSREKFDVHCVLLEKYCISTLYIRSRYLLLSYV